MPTVTSQCRLCTAHCGVRVTLDGDRIVQVAGDPDHPVSRGFTCPKGRAIARWHHAAHRLDHPRVRGDRATWDELLDDLAGHLRALIDGAGPDRVAAYYGTGATDVAGVRSLYGLVAALGSQQMYSAMSIDHAPMLRAAELVTGFPTVFPLWSPEDAAPGLILMAGTNPGVSMGYMGPVQSNWMHRLRGFRRRGGELWVLDPRRTKTAAQADRHLALRPGSDLFVFGWLVRELLAAGADARELRDHCDPADVEALRTAVGPFELAAVAERTGLSEAALAELLDAVRRHGRVGVLPGTGVSFGPESVLTSWLIWALMIVTGSLDQPGGLRFLPPRPGALDEPPLTGHAPPEGAFAPGPASRPELRAQFGERPSAALADEIEAGEIRALIVFGGDPLTALPDPDRTRRALRELDVLAVLDVFDNELTEMATHVLPSTWLTEQAYLTYIEYYGDGRAYAGPALMPPGAERRPAWWSFAQLGRRLGVDLSEGALDVDACAEEDVIRLLAPLDAPFVEQVMTAGSHGVAIPWRHGWLHEKLLPGGRWRLAPRVLTERLPRVWDAPAGGPRLVAGRITRSLNSLRYAARGDEPAQIHVSAALAGEHAIADGDRVRLSTDAGSLEGPAHVDRALGDAAVWVGHGSHDLNPNRLTDTAQLDPLTGQPPFSALPLTLARVEPT